MIPLFVGLASNATMLPSFSWLLPLLVLLMVFIYLLSCFPLYFYWFSVSMCEFECIFQWWLVASGSSGSGNVSIGCNSCKRAINDKRQCNCAVTMQFIDTKQYNLQAKHDSHWICNWKKNFIAMPHCDYQYF